MRTKKATETTKTKTSTELTIYFQIPKILLKQIGMTPSHGFVFMIIYDFLKQEKYQNGFNKTNEYISKNSLVGIRQVKNLLNDLEKWGFLIRTGMTTHRKFFLGENFYTRAESAPRQDETRAISEPNKGNIGTLSRAISELYSKNEVKNKDKNKESSLTRSINPTTQELVAYNEYKRNLDADIQSGSKPTDYLILSFKNWYETK